MRIIQRVVGRVGRRIDEVSPRVDARLADGSRVNAVVPPLALNGPKLSIRRFGVQYLQVDRLLDNGSLSPQMAEFLQGAVAARTSFLVAVRIDAEGRLRTLGGVPVPRRFADLFTEIPEHRFRLDTSSTEIRNRNGG